MQNLIGHVINERYRVEESLGSSGMADVYKVWDIRRSTYRALKHLRVIVFKDPQLFNNFKQEAKILERLLHPNIVRFHGLLESGGHVFMLMDFVERVTLQKAIMSSNGVPFSSQEILEIMQPVCSALQYAHKMGIVHGGLRPVNILIENSGWVQVAEFGVSRLHVKGEKSFAGKEHQSYLSPEQVQGKEATPRSDIYALGLVLYELLTGGMRPFSNENAEKPGPSKAKSNRESVDLKPISPRRFNSLLSKNIESVVLKCLEKKPENRFSSSLEVLDNLQHLLVELDSTQTDEQVVKPIPVAKGDWNKSSPEPEKKKRRKTNWLPYFGGILLIIAALLFGFFRPKIFSPSLETATPELLQPEISAPILTPPNTNISLPTSIPPAPETKQFEVQSPTVSPQMPTIMPSLEGVRERNGAGNINNSGLAFLHGEWIYFRNDSDNGKIYRLKIDGTIKEPLNNDNSYNIIGEGDWIYYRNDSNAGKIYRVPADGGVPEKLNDEFSAYINVVDGWIYYQNHTGGDAIYRIRIDGSGREKLNVSQSSFINVYKEWIYFVNNSDGHKIYRMRLDGSETEKISDDFSSSISISDDQVYYITRNLVFNANNNSWSTDLMTINRIQMDGSEKETLITVREGSINGYLNVIDNWIYFIPDVSFISDEKGNSINVGGLMYRMNLESLERETINNSGCNFINIAGEWVYYRKSGPGGKIHRMQLDGTGEEIVL